jgi:diguanylate cyclase (GGDEF)-like protein
VLRELAEGLGTLGRIGGEEFAVVLPGLELPSTIDWLNGAQRELELRPFALAQEIIPMGFSAGVVVAHGGDRISTDLFHHADQLLYRAKAAGRHRIAFPGWVDRRQPGDPPALG